MSLLCWRPHTGSCKEGTGDVQAPELPAPALCHSLWLSASDNWNDSSFLFKLQDCNSNWHSVKFHFFQLLHDWRWVQFKRNFPPYVFIPTEFIVCKKNCWDNRRSGTLSSEHCIWSCILQVFYNISSIMALINIWLLKNMGFFHKSHFVCLLFASWQWELDQTGQVGNSKMNKRQSRYTLNVTSDLTTVRVIEQRYIHAPDIHLLQCFLTPLSVNRPLKWA